MNDLVYSLYQNIQSTANYIDFRAMLMAPHVIYQGIEVPLIMSKLRDAFLNIMMDAEIKGIDYRYLLIDYLLNNYEIDPILEEYKDNFINTIQYIISPSSEYEEHIPTFIKERHEEKAQIFINKYSPLPKLN